MRAILIFAACSLAASVIIPRYLGPTHGADSAPALMSALPQKAADPPSNSRTVVISPGANGHFQVEGRIDGRRLDFMVDTGASVIALTEKDAAALGIHPAERDYMTMVKTANGTVRAAPVELDRVEIGDLTVRDVAALVLPDSALSSNLLGLSFLSRLHRYEFSSGKLVLEQ
jgi:aspartyl protease family protein